MKNVSLLNETIIKESFENKGLMIMYYDYSITTDNSRMHQFCIHDFKVFINENMIDNEYILHIMKIIDPSNMYEKVYSDDCCCDLLEDVVKFIKHYREPDIITIRSKKDWVTERIGEIHSAIEIYKEHNKEIPIEWKEELDYHLSCMREDSL